MQKHGSSGNGKAMDNTMRTPMLLFQLSGMFLFRYEHRALSG